MAELVIDLINRDEVRHIRQVSFRVGTYTIGTANDASVRLPGNRVAALQAQIEIRSDSAILINRDAQFILTLNGSPLLTNRPTELLDGDVIEVFIYRLTYHNTMVAQQVPGPDQTEKTDHEIVEMVSAAPSRSVEKLHPTNSQYSRYVVMSEISRYVRDLPAIYQGMESGFLGRYLRIFEAIWEPFEQRQSQITMYFDPRTSPASLLPMLEHWLAMPFSQHWPESRRRQLLAEATDLYRWRGTNNALERVIAIYTGVPPVITAHPSEPFVIQIDPRVQIKQQADQEVLILLIELFKPAHIAYTMLGSENP